MEWLEYEDLDKKGVEASYERVSKAICAGNFKAAQVKKLSGGDGKLYRAKLGDADRLIFKLVSHGGKCYALALEVVRSHAYDKSRFLSGAQVDESKLSDCVESKDVDEALAAAEPMRYVHPTGRVRYLDKPISFDDAQRAVCSRQTPLIIVGSAGSGKTALTLERMKEAEGDILYVTQSAYLAKSACGQYYANNYAKEGQQASFMSYQEFVDSVEVPSTREAQWKDFAGWFAKMAREAKGVDPHQAFEEFRGVIGAGSGGKLTRDQYLDLGVRRSIFGEGERPAVYALFEKYEAWLAASKLHDMNQVAGEWAKKPQAKYDFVVVDEVQDFTPIQLAHMLSAAKESSSFILCGDSNQIVHPNFFSWAGVKSMFWGAKALESNRELSVLSANYRNGAEATRVSNQLLKVKHARFGSVDKETNFLVEAVGAQTGVVELVADRPDVVAAVDKQISRSANFAVLVLREQDKAGAREKFHTPLLFSIQEAKGLEYENIVLYRFVSDSRKQFDEIAHGVSADDVSGSELAYGRAKDKSDRSLETHKFYVNALYVGLTRAIKNIHIVESDAKHPIFGLLGVGSSADNKIVAGVSSAEDWQREARKLELQGKTEQADAIKRDILKIKPVPWTVYGKEATMAAMGTVFGPEAKSASGKVKMQLHDISVVHNIKALSKSLAEEAKVVVAGTARAHGEAALRKYAGAYMAKGSKAVLEQCAQYGVDHRNAMNMTPLMMAASLGNIALVEQLVELGADLELRDHMGCAGLHYAMKRAFSDKDFGSTAYAKLHELLAPPFMDVNAKGSLVRINKGASEYMLMQTLIAVHKDAVDMVGRRGTVGAKDLEKMWGLLPGEVVKSERKKRAYISSVLSRNELDSSYAYGKGLLKRDELGQYQFNPALKVRAKGGEWMSIYEAVGLDFAAQFIGHNPVGLERARSRARDAGLGELSAMVLPMEDARKRLGEFAKMSQANACEEKMGAGKKGWVYTGKAPPGRRQS